MREHPLNIEVHHLTDKSTPLNVSGRNGSFSDLTSGGRILNFTGMPEVLTLTQLGGGGQRGPL